MLAQGRTQKTSAQAKRVSPYALQPANFIKEEGPLSWCDGHGASLGNARRGLSRQVSMLSNKTTSRGMRAIHINIPLKKMRQFDPAAFLATSGLGRTIVHL